MIPTILLPALLIGRWWLIPIAALAWSLWIGDRCGYWTCWVHAALLAAANAAVGVGFHQVVRRVFFSKSEAAND